MSLHNVWTIPLLTFIFSLMAFVISYLIAVYQGHVLAFLPFISDSGALAPESCIFGQLLNLSALFLGISIYLRHRQVIEFYWHHCGQKGNWRLYSTIFLWIGYVSAFGISIVANFQETNVLIVHYFGAFLAFTMGLLYIWAQTMFSYLMTPRISHRLVAHFRLALNICATVFYCSTIICASMARQPKFDTHKAGHLYRWTTEDEKYELHTAATISEWGIAVCFQLYILSFAVELRHARCHAPKLRITARPSHVAEGSDSTRSSSAS